MEVKNYKYMNQLFELLKNKYIAITLLVGACIFLFYVYIHKEQELSLSQVARISGVSVDLHKDLKKFGEASFTVPEELVGKTVVFCTIEHGAVIKKSDTLYLDCPVSYAKENKLERGVFSQRLSAGKYYMQVVDAGAYTKNFPGVITFVEDKNFILQF
jgi:hypothetical protein